MMITMDITPIISDTLWFIERIRSVTGESTECFILAGQRTRPRNRCVSKALAPAKCIAKTKSQQCLHNSLAA
jgi:hypothetical protein